MNSSIADSWLWRGLFEAVAMFWEVLWALVLGFFVSGMMQVFVSKARMQREFGKTNLRTVGLAVALGGASSSCSFAAAAAARTAYRKGAGFVPMVAFMFASTNLVFELGAILWLLMGWRFVLAEFVGAFVLVGVMWGIVRLTAPKHVLEEARGHSDEASGGHSCHGDEMETAEDDRPFRQKMRDGESWVHVGQAFVMDWQMALRDIAIGFVIAGYLAALVTNSFWNHLFLTGEHGFAARFENAFVGPLVASASFVCSIGNIPLASVLWAGGISFGGVAAFIYGDLITLPLLSIYRRYYGTKMAAYLTVVLFASMVISGLVVDFVFEALGLAPKGARAPSPIAHAGFAWNYTTWLDLAALVGTVVLVTLSRRNGGSSEHSCCSG